MSIYVGIDPGLDGAIVCLQDRGGVVEVRWGVITPTIKAKRGRAYRLSAMCSLIRDALSGGEVALAALELGGVRPLEGVRSAYTTGRGHGIWEGMLAAFAIPYEEPTPKQWQKLAYHGIIGEGKDRSILACERIFPAFDLIPGERRKKPHTGLADAALIALWAYQQRRKEPR